MNTINILKGIKTRKKLISLISFLGLSVITLAQPANNNPCAATPITANPACVPTAGTNVGATSTAAYPSPGCAAYTTGSTPDVWYSCVVPASGAITFTSANGAVGGIGDGGMAVYTGTCSALTLYACNDDAIGLMPQIAATGLTPGSTVFIMMFGFFGATGTFTICATAVAPPPPCTTNTCLTPNCITTNPTLTMCSGVPSIGSGGVYGCLFSAPNPIWNVFQATTAAPITIGANSSTGADIDYCFWGPFSSPAAGCAGISAANIISCNFTTVGSNSFTFTPVIGQYYVLLTTNYSNATGVGVNWPVSPAGSINCTSVCTTTASSNSPVCAGSALNLTTSAVAGATLYSWSGPNAFSATGQSVSIASPTTLATGTYTVTVTSPSGICTGTVAVVINPQPTVTNLVLTQTICSGGTATFTPTASIAGSTFAWTASASSGTITGFTAAGVGNISNVLTNSGTTSGTVTYVVHAISPTPASCVGPNVNFVVTVNPIPTVNPIAPISVCTGAAVAVTAITSPVAGTTFTWTNSNPAIGLAAAGAGNVPSFIATNPGATAISGTVTVTPTAAGCPGTTISFNITVNPSPTVVVPSNIIVCNGIAVAASNFTSPVAGATFSWTNSNPAIGLGASGAGNAPGFTATNPGTTAIIATIIVTASSGGCTGPPNFYTIQVNPSPTVVVPANITICAGGTIPATNFTSTVAGTTFTWTNSNPAIGLGAAGAGNIPPFVATNATGAPITATITVTPSAVACPGTPNTYTITVNPIPVITAVPNQTLCNGVATTAINFVSSVAGTTFSWTNSNSTIGLAASGIGNIASFTTTNLGVTSLTSTVTVTPAANGCNGTPINFTITVDPSPAVTNPVLTQEICTGGTATFVPTSNVAGATFSWTASSSTGTITGFTAAGAGNISDVITNSGTSSGTVTYVVTPSAGGLGCPGAPSNFVVTVDPTPAITNLTLTQTICTGLTASFIPTSNVINTTFSWTASASAGTITGFTAVGAGTISDILTNSGTTPGTVTYLITPTGPAPSLCPGPSVNFVVTVNPAPTVNAVANQTVCNGANTTAISFTSPTAGANFSWTNSDVSIGLVAGGVGNIPSFVATNAGTTSVTSTIVVTASANGCFGTPISFTITVDPTPTVTNATLTQEICSGNAAGFTPTSNVTGATFSYTASGSSANVTGFTAAGAGNINDVLTNTGTAVETVTYVVTPAGPAASLCPGTPSNFVVTVDPIPTVTNGLLTQSFCSGGTASFSPISGVVGTTFSWTATASAGTITGFAASGTGNINDIIINAGNATGTVTYVITPTGPAPSTCVGTPVNFVVSIDPAPSVTNAVLTQEICSGGTATFVPTSNVAGATFSWTAVASGTVLGYTAAGAGNINDIITNPGTSPGTVTYSVTAASAALGCVGTPVDFVVTVDPAPTVTNPTLTQTICTGGSATFTPTANVINTTFTWTASASSASVTGFTAAGAGTISDVITSTSPNPETVTYVITPTGPAPGFCPGTPVNFVVTINSSPVTDPIANQTVCNGANTTLINFTSTTGGSGFSWTNSDASIGLVVGGVGNIPLFTATNAGTTSVTATITVTANASTCFGPPITFTITVDPTPAITNATLADDICSASSATFTPTSNVVGATFAYTASGSSANITGFTAAGAGNISDVLTNSGFNIETVTYFVTPTGPGASLCPGTPSNYVVTVDPTPDVSNAVLTQSFCSGGSASLTPTSNVVGTTFAWTASASAGTVTGFTAAGTGSINDIISNTGTTTETITYVITPTGPAPNNCVGLPVNFVISVDPEPAVTNATLTQEICSGSSATFNPTSNVAGATFSWTAVATGGTLIGYTVAGAGNINDAITNVGSAPQTVTYTVTGASAALGCLGTPVDFVVTVDPSPTLSNATLTQTMCSGDLASFIPTSNVINTTFTWTASASAGTLTGFSAAGAGTISDVITNSGSTIETVTYVITPTGPAPSLCSGVPVNFVVTVNPAPVVDPVANQTVCDNSNTTAITFTSATAGANFSWSNSDASIGLAGGGGGNIAIFTATNPTTTSVTATITVTAIANACFGPPLSFTITVDPTPTITNGLLTQGICSGGTATFTPTSGVTGATFAYTAVASSGAVTGFTAAGAGNINDVLTNTGFNIETVTYSVTPTGPAPSTCPGTPSDFVVTLNPIPDVSNAVLTQAMCSGATASFVPTSNVAGTTFDWTATSSAGTITGFTAAGSGAINDIITNSGATQETVTYVITPNNGGCTGTPVNFVVTIDPAPSVTNSPLTQDICSASAAAVTLTSNVAGATFAWTSSASTGTITGFTVAGAGDINDVLSNSGTTSGTVTYVIAASSPGALACPGTPVNYTFTVEPAPVVTNPLLTQAICAGTAATFVPTSNVAGTTFTWTASASAGTVSGFTASGSGNINDVINNPSGSAIGTVTYVITPVGPGATACAGTPVNFVVTVTPIPAPVAGSNTPVCAGSSLDLTGSAGLAGTTYSWTGPGGYVSAVQNPTVSPAATVAMAGVYTLTETINTCVGSTTTTVVVNPLPTATVTGGGQVCAGAVTPTVTITLTGASPWTVSYSNGLTNTTINPSSPVVNLTDPGAGAYTVTFVSDINCTGTFSGLAADIVHAIPVPVLTPDITGGCAPLCVTFVNHSTVATAFDTLTNFSISFGDTTFSTVNHPGPLPITHCYPDGIYSVTYTVTSGFGCAATVVYTDEIRSFTPPTAIFTTSPTVMSLQNPNVLFRDHSLHATSWYWDFGDSLNVLTDTSTLENPRYTYTAPGTYCTYLTVANGGVCFDTTHWCITVQPDFAVYIPNAFTPNGDHYNDEFFCKGTNVMKFEMYIYDRWGNMTFHSTDINAKWDGTYGGKEAPEDVYVYVVVAMDDMNQDHKYVGSITLVR